MKSFFVRFVLLFAAVFGVLFLFVWFYLSVTSAVKAADAPLGAAGEIRGETVTFEIAPLAIVTQDGQERAFRVELALTPAQQRHGLMFRERLEAGHGMLFDYDQPRRIAMWMKNTPIPLDMLFADGRGRVVHIATDTEPFSLKLIPAPLPVRYVLEVPAGTVAALGLRIGDRLIRR